MKNIKVINMNGTEIDFDSAVALMDDELREKVHAAIIPSRRDDPQWFFSVYEVCHREKYGEDWELSKKNPVW